MKKLARPSIDDTELSKILEQYKTENKKWENLQSTDKKLKKLLWSAIEKMQGTYCCYCEIFFNVDKKDPRHLDRHIEHFYAKSKYSDKTFDWDNLFGSCGRRGGSTCGHHKKDRDSSDLIKPDHDNPADFLQFSSTGKVEAKSNLDDCQRTRAKTTIEILNLNEQNLVNERQKTISTFQKELNEIDNLKIEEQKKYFYSLEERIISGEEKISFKTALLQVYFQ
jgi:uncharacterized protein (TIGR02646 family)